MDIKLNEVIFVGVFIVCSYFGMVEEGRCLFRSMVESYGVVLIVDYYVCMVDFFGRFGYLEEVFDLVKLMLIYFYGGVWGVFFGVCSIYNNFDIVEFVVSYLFEFEFSSVGNYILLVNILVLVGRWDSVLSVRKLMLKKGLKKNFVCSWLEGKKGSIYEFFVGDLINLRFREIE